MRPNPLLRTTMIASLVLSACGTANSEGSGFKGGIQSQKFDSRLCANGEVFNMKTLQDYIYTETFNPENGLLYSLQTRPGRLYVYTFRGDEAIAEGSVTTEDPGRYAVSAPGEDGGYILVVDIDQNGVVSYGFSSGEGCLPLPVDEQIF
ncbi:hypothetical protein HYV12_04475 [Candidatus Dojkabacteria bacterium]|nr:hypothetical protein [Candidatus Dojkabacteria bacterium]